MMLVAVLPMFLAALQIAAADRAPVLIPAPPDAVEIVLYSDFQCPFCVQLAPAIRELQTKGIDGVRTSIVFKNFPLSIHPNAQRAHQAAMAAKAQGKFWEMHDLLFANPSKVQRSEVVTYAKQLKLDLVRFERDLDSDRIKEQIAADVAEGSKAGVSGTPSYTINGKLYSGTKSLAELTELIAGDYRRIRAVAEIGDQVLSKGPADAAVTLELFADLESPVSKPALDVISLVMQHYPLTVRLQFRNFPLAFHPQAQLAHEAAMTAARQGRFWELVSYILAHQGILREQDLITVAGQLGLDEAQFADALRTHRNAPRVEADLVAGQKRGIRGSPVVIVNNERIDGVPDLKRLTEYVEAALKKGSAPSAAVIPQP